MDDLRINDLEVCECLDIEVFYSDDEKKEGVSIFSQSGEVLAVFPRGKIPYDFWNYMVYSLCVNLNCALNCSLFPKITCKLNLNKKRKKNRLIGQKILNEI